MSTLYRLADQRARRRVVSFNRHELSRLLGLYSKRVASGEWRDYAIDFRPGMAIFSIFRHTSEQPLFAIAKVPNGAKDGYAVYTKRTDAQKCLEHHMGEWQIKPVSAKVPRPSLAFMMLLEKRCPLMCCVCREKTVATRTYQGAACWSSAPTACGGNTMARQ